MTTVHKPFALIAELSNIIIKSQGFAIIHNNKGHMGFKSHFAHMP